MAKSAFEEPFNFPDRVTFGKYKGCECQIPADRHLATQGSISVSELAEWPKSDDILSPSRAYGGWPREIWSGDLAQPR